MKLNTLRFGEIDYNDEDILKFPKGLLGFSDEDQFILLTEVVQAPFMWLQSLRTPELAFVLIDPWVVKSDYDLVLSQNVRERLKITHQDQVMILSIAVIPEDFKKMTANLRAPLVINVKVKLGEQIILSDETYNIHHPVLTD